MSTVSLTTKQAFLLERWQQILNDPLLDQYENFRIETDGNGEILMSPSPSFATRCKFWQFFGFCDPGSRINKGRCFRKCV